MTTTSNNIKNCSGSSPCTEGIQNPDILAVRAYITGADERRYDAIDPDQVLIDLTHSNLHQRHIEIRVYKHDTIEHLRKLIHQKSGTTYQYQKLQVFDINNELISEIPDQTAQYDDYKLGYFGIVQHGIRIHCIDTNMYSISAGGALENTALVEKFRLTEEQYDAKQSNTVRAWARQQKQINPKFTYEQYAKQHAALIHATKLYKSGHPLPPGFRYDHEAGKVIVVNNTNDDDEDDENYNELVDTSTTTLTNDNIMEYGPESVQHIVLDSRCQVQPGKRRGRVAWMGEVQSTTLQKKMPGYWVGIIFDEPVGKCNGTLEDGIQYFNAPGDKYGSFIRGRHVEIGNFPERDLLDDDDDDDDDDDEDEL